MDRGRQNNLNDGARVVVRPLIVVMERIIPRLEVGQSGSESRLLAIVTTRRLLRPRGLLHPISCLRRWSGLLVLVLQHHTWE
jgi:hypothetical protein